LQFVKESFIRATPARVFAFHELPDAINRLLPPWEKARIIQAAPNLQVGSRAIIDTKLFGFFTVRWVAEHTAYDPPRMFEDVQIKGPFHLWRHRHIILPHEAGTLLRDEIEYEPPFGFPGKLFAPALVAPQIKRMFEYRHETTRRWCEGESSFQ